MKLNPDMVPINLEEAIKTLTEGLTPEDIAEIKRPNFVPSQVHMTVGIMLRNEWSLWDKDSILMRWFKKNYGIDHADDVSGLILDTFCRDIRGEPRRDKELAKRYIAHWKDTQSN